MMPMSAPRREDVLRRAKNMINGRWWRVSRASNYVVEELIEALDEEIKHRRILERRLAYYKEVIQNLDNTTDDLIKKLEKDNG